MMNRPTLLLLGLLGLIWGSSAMTTVTVKEGDEAVLPCPFGRLDNIQVVWTDQNKAVLTFMERRIKDDSRMSAVNNGTSWNLHLQAVTADDQGVYTCRINTNPVRMRSVLLQLAGEEPPQTFDIKATNLTIDEGQKVTLPCSFEQKPDVPKAKVTWTDPKSMLLAIEQRILITDSRFSISFAEPATWDLTLTSAKPSDSGVYTCRVNTATLSMRTVNLTVTAVEKPTEPGEEGDEDEGEEGEEEGQPTTDADGVQEVRAEVGRVAFLPCQHAASHTNRVQWRKNETLLSIGKRRMTQDRRMHIRRPDTQTWTLRIRPVKSSDAGLYECVDTENKETKTLRLVVVDPPTFTNKYWKDEVMVSEGSNVILSCSAVGIPEPQYTWYRRSESDSSDSEEFTTTLGTLQIENVQRNFTGMTFTCKVDNGVRKPLTRQATIRVLYAPEITIPEGPLQMTAGSRLSVVCDVMGPQGTEVTWWKLPQGEGSEDGMVDLDVLRADFGFTVFEFVQSPGHLRLVLEKQALEEDDFATYRCSANNSQGQSQGHIDVVELKVYPSLNVTGTKGQPVVLPCGTDELSGDVQVTWLMNEKIIAANERVMAFDPRYSISAPSPGKWNLVISDVKPSDEGEYRCLVDTGVKEEYTFLLSVDVPTRLTAPPLDMTVRQGEDVTLRCEFEGEPQPEVTWFRYSSRGREEVTDLIRSDGGYVLTDAEKEHTGVYECVANNQVHPTAAGNATLTVMFTPEVSIMEDDLEAGRGEGVSMTCVVAAMPRVTGVWIKDGAQIEAARRRGVELLAQEMDMFTTKVTLNLNAASDRDFGTYRCMATNAMGQGHDQLTLTEEDVDSETGDQKKRRKKNKKNKGGDKDEDESSPEPEVEATLPDEDSTPYIHPTPEDDQGVPAGPVTGGDNAAGFTSVSMATLLTAVAASLTTLVLPIPSLT